MCLKYAILFILLKSKYLIVSCVMIYILSCIFQRQFIISTRKANSWPYYKYTHIQLGKEYTDWTEHLIGEIGKGGATNSIFENVPFNPLQLSEAGIIVSILQMRKLRLKEVNRICNLLKVNQYGTSQPTLNCHLANQMKARVMFTHYKKDFWACFGLQIILYV